MSPRDGVDGKSAEGLERRFVVLAAAPVVVPAGGLAPGVALGCGLRSGLASAAGAAALGDPVGTALVGVFDITKVGSQAWTVGARVYWDDTNKRCTTVATENTLIGVAVEAVASGAGDTIGRVRLNATF